MAYYLTKNVTGRNLPQLVQSDKIVQLPKRSKGESIGFDEGGDIALILGPDGETLARYDYKGYFFSAEAYLNG